MAWAVKTTDAGAGPPANGSSRAADAACRHDWGVSGRTRERERCERCGREADTVFTVRVGVYPDPDADRVVCAACHEEIRLFLLGLASAASLHAAPGADAREEPDAEPISRAGRLRLFLLRSLVYVGIAVGIFVLATWLMAR